MKRPVITRVRGIMAVIFIAALLLAGIIAWQTQSPQAISQTPDNPPIILITLDTTRPDHLGCYGYSENTSPHIDKIASSGVRFTNCYTSMPTTDPAHASILTGTYPRTHGVLKNGMEISNPDVVSLAQYLKQKGYVTAAITARAHLSPDSLKLKGFDFARAPEKKTRLAEPVYQDSIEYLRERAGSKFFLWIHFWDPHTPYAPPAPFHSASTAGIDVLPEKYWGSLPPGIELTKGQIEYATSLYDSEIRYTDYYIGKLMDYVEKQISTPSISPLIVVVADHGEILGELQEEYGYTFDHGLFLYDSNVKVPLIIRWKGRLPENKVVSSLVRSIDIAPTVADLLFGQEAPQFEGASLENLLLGGADSFERSAIIQRRRYNKPPTPPLACEEFALVSGEYKLIQNAARGDELYHLVEDALEEENLAESQRQLVAELKGELRAWQDNHAASPTDQVISKEKADELRSLGYLP